MTSRKPTEVPGASIPTDAAPEDHVRGTDSAEVIRLRAALDAANAKLAERPAVPDAPQVVYEPKTTHGEAARAANKDTAHLTTTEVMSLIDASEMKEPLSQVLCRDGWYVRRS